MAMNIHFSMPNDVMGNQACSYSYVVNTLTCISQLASQMVFFFVATNKIL